MFNVGDRVRWVWTDSDAVGTITDIKSFQDKVYVGWDDYNTYASGFYSPEKLGLIKPVEPFEGELEFLIEK